MFDDVLALMEQKIRAEAAKEPLDVFRLRDLMEIYQFVKSRSLVSVEDVVPSIGGTVQATQRIAMPAGTPHRVYGPSANEQLIDQMGSIVEKAFTISQLPKTESLISLAESYKALQATDPDLAARIRALMEKTIKTEEERDASLHSELLGRREVGGGGDQHLIDLPGADAPGGTGS